MQMRVRVSAAGVLLVGALACSVVVPLASGARTDVHDPSHLDVQADGSVQVGGMVWDDYDHDGIRDPDEPGLAGVAVAVVDVRGDPVVDLNGNQVFAYPTGGDGVFLFDGLAPGIYRVKFSPWGGFLPTLADKGRDDTVDSDGTNTLVVLPVRNQIDSTLGAGFFLPAELGDRVWLDADRDGVQGDGEPSLPGVTVTLLDGAGAPVTTDVFGAPIGSAITDSAGAYRFAGLAPGSYRVRFAGLPVGYVATGTAVGSNHTIDSNGLISAPALVDSGEVDLSVDLGARQPA